MNFTFTKLYEQVNHTIITVVSTSYRETNAIVKHFSTTGLPEALSKEFRALKSLLIACQIAVFAVIYAQE